MLHISLFSGIGGFDLASTWAGWENIVSCEINPFAQRNLKYYWPEAYHHNDIHTLTYKTIDEELTKRKGPNWRADKIVLSGGFPCQPYSTSGKRKGKEDPRHLWPEMLRTIKEIQPDWIVGENVYGLVNWNGGLVFNEVQTDLENQGYEVQPYLLPACGKDAPHKRYRIFIVAYRDNRTTEHKIPTGREQFAIPCNKQPIADTQSGRPGILRNESEEAGPRKGNQLFGGQCGVADEPRYAPDTDSTGRRKNNRQGKSKLTYKNGPANYWENWPTEYPICSGVNGISSKLDRITLSKWRNESLKGYGNAVVPQLVLSIFNTINKYEKLLNENKI